MESNTSQSNTLVNLPDWMNSTSANIPSSPESDHLIKMSDEKFNKLVANRKPSREVTCLRDHQFSIIFDSVMSKLASGKDIQEIMKEDFRQFDYSEFLIWVDKDPEMKTKYEYAEKIRAEIVFSQIIRIADGEDEMSDVARDKLRIDSRKYTLGVWNKKRFAETKQIDVNTSISINEAMKKANDRLADIVDVDFEEEE